MFKLSRFFLDFDVFMSLKVVASLATSFDPDKMQHHAAFHLDLYCLPKYPFMGFPVCMQRVKVEQSDSIVSSVK